MKTQVIKLKKGYTVYDMIWGEEQCDLVKPERWRAKEGRPYYYINERIEVQYNFDRNKKYDDKQHETGNYFETKEEAEKVANKIRQILKEQ